VTVEHGGGASADLVDIVDLPRRVMAEVDGGLLREDVVVVGGAAHEGGEAGASSLILKPRPSTNNRCVDSWSTQPNTT
jgi:hypothetical protein